MTTRWFYIYDGIMQVLFFIIFNFLDYKTKLLTKLSRAVSNFYETEIKIWAGFGPVDNTEKRKFGPIMSNF